MQSTAPRSWLAPRPVFTNENSLPTRSSTGRCGWICRRPRAGPQHRRHQCSMVVGGVNKQTQGLEVTASGCSRGAQRLGSRQRD